MTKDKALKQALEALKGLKSMYGGNGHKLHEINMIHRKHDTAITALEEVLAQTQEPRNVRERWNVELDGNDLLVCFNDHEKGDKCQYERYVPANSTPPQRKPLTDEQIWDAYMKAPVDIDCHVSDLHKFARAIEAAHGIKENT